MQGEGKNTQAEINKILGINSTLFKHLIALNTYTEPFLALRAHEQREMIELILGVTQLSEKAEVLKETIKEVKTNIKEEEFKVKAQQEANAKQQIVRRALASTSTAKLYSLRQPKGNPAAPDLSRPTVARVQNLKVWFPLRRGILRTTIGQVI